LLVVFWMRPEEEQPEEVQARPFPVPTSSAFVLTFCAVGLVILGVLPSTVLDLTSAFFDGVSQVALGL
jgi:NADH:ubiquinone oxidoreductase subunit 2 (subunit N)